MQKHKIGVRCIIDVRIATGVTFDSNPDLGISWLCVKSLKYGEQYIVAVKWTLTTFMGDQSACCILSNIHMQYKLITKSLFCQIEGCKNQSQSIKQNKPHQQIIFSWKVSESVFFRLCICCFSHQKVVARTSHDILWVIILESFVCNYCIPGGII